MTDVAPLSKKLSSGSVGTEEKVLTKKKKGEAAPAAVIEGNPFGDFELKDVVLFVPIEGSHKDRTLELLQSLSETNDFEVPYIAHQIRLDRIGSKVIFPVVAFATSTGPKGDGQRKNWRLHIGAAVECSKALSQAAFDDETETPSDYNGLAKKIQKSLKRKGRDAGPSYLVRLGSDKIMTMVSC